MRETRRRVGENVLLAGFLVIVLSVWELAGRGNPRVLSYPSQIATSAWELIVVENKVLPALLATVEGLAYGFVIAAVLGIVVGFAMGRIRLVELVLYPYAIALYATPRIALVPLLVLWFGIDLELRVVVVVLSAVFPIMINTYNGARQVDPAYLDAAAAFAATPWQTLRTVVMPASVPYVFAGLRVGMVRALVGVVVAEMTASVVGTGRLIIELGAFFQTGRLLVPVMVLGVLGVVLSVGMAKAQTLAAPWAMREGR